MRIALAAGAALAWLLLLLPLLAVLVHSFGAGPSAPDLGSDMAIPGPTRLLSGLGTSLLLAAVSTAAALMVGIPAALGLTRARLPGRRALLALLVSPLCLPGLVLGFGVLSGATLLTRAAGIPLAGSSLPLAAAHLLLTVPWVTRSVTAALESADGALEEQARGLGAGPFAVLFLVTLPSARSGILAGAASAFALSFGNLALSLLLAGGGTVTLPVAIYEAAERRPDPTAAAAGVLAIGVALAAAFCTVRVSGGDPRRR